MLSHLDCTVPQFVKSCAAFAKVNICTKCDGTGMTMNPMDKCMKRHCWMLRTGAGTGSPPSNALADLLNGLASSQDKPLQHVGKQHAP